MSSGGPQQSLPGKLPDQRLAEISYAKRLPMSSRHNPGSKRGSSDRGLFQGNLQRKPLPLLSFTVWSHWNSGGRCQRLACSGSIRKGLWQAEPGFPANSGSIKMQSLHLVYAYVAVQSTGLDSRFCGMCLKMQQPVACCWRRACH